MKKSLITISALILLLSVSFSACGNKPYTLTDNSGLTHVIVTDEDKNFVQNEYGEMYEEVENDKGEKVTQLYNFPKVITNKRKTKIENAVAKIDVPHGWEMSGSKSYMRISHKGKCRDLHQLDCQIEISYSDDTLEDKYNKRIEDTNKFNDISGKLSKIEQKDTRLLGKDAKSVSYYSADDELSNYYYYIEQFELVVEVRISFFDSCFTIDELEELLSSCCTLKDLGGSAE